MGGGCALGPACGCVSPPFNGACVGGGALAEVEG